MLSSFFTLILQTKLKGPHPVRLTVEHLPLWTLLPYKTRANKSLFMNSTSYL